MEKYREVLEAGNIVVVDCGLEKYRETTWSNRDKVTFKIAGISYIGKGTLPLNELSTLGASRKCCYRIVLLLYTFDMFFLRFTNVKECFS